MATHHIAIQWSDDKSDSLQGEITETGNEGEKADLTIGVNATNEVHELDFPFTNLKLVFLLADADMTVKFDSSSSPTPSIPLVAGVPFFVVDGSLTPFTVDVTQIFVTCVLGGTLHVRTLQAA